MHKTRKNNNPKYNIPIQLSHNNSISPGKSTSRSQWKGEGCAQVDVSGIGNGNGNGRVKDKGKGKGKDKGRGGYEGKEKYGDKQNRDDIKQYKDNTNKIPTSIPTAPSRTQCHSPALTSLNPNIEINNTNTYNKNNKVTNNNNQLQSLAITNKKDR